MKNLVLYLFFVVCVPCLSWADGKTIVLVEIVKTTTGELILMPVDYAEIESRESWLYLASEKPQSDWVEGQKYAVWCVRDNRFVVDGKGVLTSSWFGLDRTNKFYSPNKREKVTWEEFKKDWIGKREQTKN